MNDTRASKRLAFVLRHDPTSVGLTLDRSGWADVPTLLRALAAAGMTLTRVDLEHLVSGSDKQRFELDGDRVRARQGHSIPVDLDLPEAVPPDVLFHGTPLINVSSILDHGLTRGSRHHVHLSPDVQTAERVGARRGAATVLVVDASRMARDGFQFFITGNGVWLTDYVPAEYVRVESPSATEGLGCGVHEPFLVSERE